VALTLREVCGLTIDEIARAFLAQESAHAPRIVRAKTKIRDAKIPYEVPGKAELPERLEAVLRAVYLVFNEGYLGVLGRFGDARGPVPGSDTPRAGGAEPIPYRPTTCFCGTAPRPRTAPG
jgi:hypothetical protein